MITRVDSAPHLLAFNKPESYAVVGVCATNPGIPADLCHRIAHQGEASTKRLERTVIVAAVDPIFHPIDFLILSVKFGRGFQHFLLLNDVAVEACLAAEVHLQIEGHIRQSELAHPSTVLSCPYWT